MKASLKAIALPQGVDLAFLGMPIRNVQGHEAAEQKLALWQERLAEMARDDLAAWPVGYGEWLERDGVERLVAYLAEEVALGRVKADAQRERERTPPVGYYRVQSASGVIRWEVRIHQAGRQVYGGRYATEAEAAARVAAMRGGSDENA